MPPQPRLCVFVKAPVPGKVKRRLASDLGAKAACAAYEALAEHVLPALAETSLPKELWVAGDIAHPRVAAWAERWGFAVLPQPEGDLGVRMLAAVVACCRAGHSALVVGSDLPALDAAYVEQGAAALQSHDAVLGPAEDGGYGLVGLRAPVPELFRGIPWGTARVLAATRAKIAGLKLKVAELPTLWDVDDLKGWRRFQALPQRRPRACVRPP